VWPSSAWAVSQIAASHQIYANRIARWQPGTSAFSLRAGAQVRVKESFGVVADAVNLPERNQCKDNSHNLWTPGCLRTGGRWITVSDAPSSE